MNTRSAMIRARSTPELKTQAEDVLARLGIRPSEAINMFYAQVVLHQGLPFPVRLAAAPPAPARPETPDWHLPDVWTRLGELDQWRRFAGRLERAELMDPPRG